MLDMGFLPDIRRVLRHIPAKRQTLFFSATIPPPIADLARDMLHEAETINLQRRSAPAVGITQAVYPVPRELKSALLLALLQRNEIKDAIVFCRTKHRANRLSEYLAKQGVPNAKIHGNRSQAQRTEALAGFKSGKYRIMVATDIAARGIDVEALSHVVNFDVPGMPEDYIHRVGRTARAEADGDAFTFVSPQEQEDLARIEREVGALCRKAASGHRCVGLHVVEPGDAELDPHRLAVEIDVVDGIGERLGAVQPIDVSDGCGLRLTGLSRSRHRGPSGRPARDCS